MKCRDCQAYIERWLEDHLAVRPTSAGLPAEVLDHLVTCQACSLQMETAKRIAGSAIDTSIEMPEGMTNRIEKAVMATIKQEERFNGRRRTPFGATRYIIAAAALVVALIPVLGRLDQDPLSGSQVQTEWASITLKLEEPQAQTVVVVGDWNNWNPQVDYLAKASPEGPWVIDMQLKRGQEYRYQFVIDGKIWKADPLAYLQVDDGFGGKNSVIEM